VPTAAQDLEHSEPRPGDAEAAVAKKFFRRHFTPITPRGPQLLKICDEATM
jgi:hypothetical protein